MATALLGSLAAHVSAANAVLTKNPHSLVSTASAVSVAPNFSPYRVPTANPISTVPYALP
jgi:hypothetical protein